MKKANLLKKTAFPRVPSVSDGFVPLDGFGFKFVVSLSGVDIKIHGFNGSSWELLHETDGLTESYIAEVTHQKYFFESKNGEEQTVRVSFLSSEKEQNLGLRAGVSKETRKFHDIEEVPVYRSGMQGKMLTIMSNGTLAWLLANESFVIEEEGVQQPPPPANVVGLEEDAGLILHGNAQLINGVLELDGSAGTYASLPHSTEYERESGDMTINFWFNADSMPAETGSTFISKSTGSHAWDGWVIYYSTQGSGVGGTGPAMTNGGVGLYIDQTGSGQPTHTYRAAPAGGLPTGAWHHVAVTMPATGDYSLFVNGESILSWSPPSRNTSTNSSLMFGANAKHQEIGNFFSGKIDGVVIQKQILTAQEISDLHSAGRNASQPQPEQPQPEQPAPTATLEGWETPFVLGGSGQFQNLEGVGTRLKTLSDGYAYARWDDFLTSKYSSWTTSVWFRTTDLSMTGMNRKLFGQRNGDHGMVFKLIDSSGSGDVRLSYGFPKAGNWTNYPTYAFNLTKDVWVNLVVTFDAATLRAKVYLNGQLINTVGAHGTKNLISDATADLSTTVSSGFLPLASNSKGSDGGSSIHYFDFYGFQMVEDVVLTDSQVATVYNDGSNQNVIVSSDL